MLAPKSWSLQSKFQAVSASLQAPWRCLVTVVLEKRLLNRLLSLRQLLGCVPRQHAHQLHPLACLDRCPVPKARAREQSAQA